MSLRYMCRYDRIFVAEWSRGYSVDILLLSFQHVYTKVFSLFLNKDFLIDLEVKWLQFKKNKYNT